MPAPRALTDEQVAEIREKYASGRYALSTLASRYHVSPSLIHRTVEGIKRPKARGLDMMAWSRYGER